MLLEYFRDIKPVSRFTRVTCARLKLTETENDLVIYIYI